MTCSSTESHAQAMHMQLHMCGRAAWLDLIVARSMRYAGTVLLEDTSVWQPYYFDMCKRTWVALFSATDELVRVETALSALHACKFGCYDFSACFGPQQREMLKSVALEVQNGTVPSLAADCAQALGELSGSECALEPTIARLSAAVQEVADAAMGRPLSAEGSRERVAAHVKRLQTFL
eukprot:TRINITY_DN2232_c0_g3_i4.p1 TRINITY_DN2232_c0_g3~~TRINITY_DN2232_c0_g3_i4.p1  ORF type:complete len:179 (-),score=38.55 TRINITY_DN2232_c0_g3_i4:269-805(-)